MNFINEDVGRCMSHGLDPQLIRAQAQAIKIPIIQRRVTWDTYEGEFKKAIGELKQVGVKGAVFGDVDLQEHKDWVDRVCREMEVEPIETLWGADPEQILTDFVREGFEAIVVRVKADLFDEEWLGRVIDEALVKMLKERKIESNFHLLGERGEYHTFVVGGHIFERRIEILEADKILKNGYWLLDISKWE